VASRAERTILHDMGQDAASHALDVYSRGIVGWQIADHLPTWSSTRSRWRSRGATSPAASSYTTATPAARYTSIRYSDRLADAGIRRVLGSVGDCYDCAVIESFWARVEVEFLNRQRWRTRIELANAIFEYLDIFRNRQRRHSSIGMRTPIEYVTLHQTLTVA